MCLIFAANRCVPGYRLLVVANRDEFHARPSAAIHRWEDAPEVIAGRDLEAGGTWLGVTPAGRFAGLTNYSEGVARNTARPSRGALVTAFLTSEHSSAAYLQQLAPEQHLYSGFNLLVDDGEVLAYGSNRGDPCHALPPGIFGLSNHLLDTPWPKVEHGKNVLSEMLAQGRWPEDEPLFELMNTRRSPMTASEAAASVSNGTPPFILGDVYGTRATTIVAFFDDARDGHGWVAERRYDCRGEVQGTERLEF